jgi:hypothetical protein
LYFQPQCGSLMIDPVRCLPDSDSSSELGRVALATFLDCKPEGSIPWPTDWKAFVRPTLQAMRVADWDELMEGAFMVSLDIEEDRLILSPLRTSQGGFMPATSGERVAIPAESSPESIGDAIRLALTRCEVGAPPKGPLPLEPEADDWS